MLSAPTHGTAAIRPPDQASTDSPWQHDRYMSSHAKLPRSMTSYSLLRRPFTTRPPARRSVVCATRSGTVTAEAAGAHLPPPP